MAADGRILFLFINNGDCADENFDEIYSSGLYLGKKALASKKSAVEIFRKLKEDEKIYLIATVIYNKKKGALILSDKRIMFLSKSMFGSEQFSIKREDVVSKSFKGAFGVAEYEIETNHKNYKFEKMSRKVAEKMNDILDDF